MLKSLIHHVVTFDENLQNCQTLVIPNKVIRGTKFCLTRYYENLGCQTPKKKKNLAPDQNSQNNLCLLSLNIFWEGLVANYFS